VSGTENLAPLRRAAERLRKAEAERNRMLRAMRAQNTSIPKLSEAADLSVGKVHSLTKPSRIVSIGYEGRTVDVFMSSLIEAGVGVLVDVRENAISRKPGFSKKALSARCEAEGIEYVHEPSLGNPRSNRDDFRAGTSESREVFTEHMSLGGHAALDRVVEQLKSRTVALLCFEADQCQCHRSLVAEALLRRDPLASVLQA
jgi:uncharacterized protein (DUF488 family)